jgi:Fanconi anemia group M protein
MSTTFFQIFSKRPEKMIKDSPKIIADYREKNSLVIAKLINLGAQVETRELKVADYIANSTAVERKTISDFLSSMKNKRLSKQLEELQQYNKRLLIIEGFQDENLYEEGQEGINPNAIRGFLLSILLRYNVPIVFTKDEEDTAKFLLVLSKKKDKEASLNVKKKNLNNKEQMQFILEGFQGIGPKNAKKLLDEFKTLEKLFNTKVEDIEKIIGKKAEVFKLIKEEY